MSHAETESDSGRRGRRAGAFDIRSVIALLLGLYGVILVLTGFVTGEDQIARADGLNINLAGGIGMLVVAALFELWARLRPIVVPPEVEQREEPREEPPPEP